MIATTALLASRIETACTNYIEELDILELEARRHSSQIGVSDTP